MVLRLIAVVVIALGLLTLLALSQAGDEPLKVSGFVEADEIRLGSRVGGRVAEVLCEEGEVVEAGRALIRLEAFDLGDRRAQAEANLRAEQANLERLRNGYRKEEIAQAKARVDRLSAIVTKLKAGPLPEEVRASESRVALAPAQQERAKTSYDRVVLPFKRETGTVSREDVDRATEELRVAEENLKVRQEELQLLVTGTPRAEDIAAAEAELEEAKQAWQLVNSGSRPEDIAAATAAVAATQAALNAVDAQMQELEIKAPVNATVDAVELQKGDLVAAGAPVLSLIDTSHLWVRAYVPENRLDFRLNDEVVVVADSYQGDTFRGRITFVASQAEFTPNNVQTPEERSKQVFRIKVTLLSGQDKLRPGCPSTCCLATM